MENITLAVKLLNNSIYFEIVINALHDCFCELGIAHEVVTRVAPMDPAIYIICTTHEDHPLPENYISYNYEQLTTNKQWPPKFFDRLKNARQVWDYSLKNIEILRDHHDITAIHVPFGHTKNMLSSSISKPPSSAIRDIDITFVGAINPSRKQPLQAMMDQKIAMFVSSNCFGNNLINVYHRSKLGLNLHFYQGKTILEVHRIIPMIINGVYVVSERSDDNWYDSLYDDLVDFVDKQKIPEYCVDLLEKQKTSTKYVHEEAERRCRLLVDKCSMVKFIRNVLHHLDIPIPTYKRQGYYERSRIL
jgi:hypothetical protein